jgi:ADP-ribose pyrophosphatase YjhB (NUDIX family)
MSTSETKSSSQPTTAKPQWAGVLIITDNGEVLLGTNTKRGNWWTNVGGGVLDGGRGDKTVADAALRELKEETLGCVVMKDADLSKCPYSERDGKSFQSRLYLARATSIDVKQLHVKAAAAQEALKTAEATGQLSTTERSKLRESTEFDKFQLVSLNTVRERAAVYFKSSNGGQQQATLVSLDGLGVLSPSFCCLVCGLPSFQTTKYGSSVVIKHISSGESEPELSDTDHNVLVAMRKYLKEDDASD